MPEGPDPPAAFNRLRAVVERRRAEARLAELARKRVTAGFVRALVVFEARFGALWGHGRPESECSPGERALRELWRLARGEILENGNAQVRSLALELAAELPPVSIARPEPPEKIILLPARPTRPQDRPQDHPKDPTDADRKGE